MSPTGGAVNSGAANVPLLHRENGRSTEEIDCQTLADSCPGACCSGRDSKITEIRSLNQQEENLNYYTQQCGCFLRALCPPSHTFNSRPHSPPSPPPQPARSPPWRR
jgi:hypothetical protein